MARRLAAIMMADVVGFSRLMNDDELGTLSALQKHRAEVFDPVIAARGGRVVKLMGDGALVEFTSVVEAVEAALTIQQRTVQADGQIRMRIGINLGDVIIEGEDIFGDGVNIVARLEALADPDGICITSIVQESIDNRIDASFEDAGQHKVKGIAQPIHVYRWPATGAVQRQSEIPSIAILPFENVSRDSEDTYFAHGMTDDIATDLSRISGVLVIAGSATLAYKDRSVGPSQVAQELGVRYVLEGSVRRGGGRVRVNARLTDAESSAQLWADRFDGDLQEILDLQDRISESIVATLSITLSRAEQERAFRKDVKDLRAYDYVLQANALHSQFTKETNAQALELYKRAMELDPDYAPAHAGFAWAMTHESNQEWSPEPKQALELALKHARLAVRLASGLAKAHMVLGDVYCWMRQHSLAVSEGRKAVELDPNNADVHFALSYYLVTAGKSDEAVEEARLALRYNPIYARCDYYEMLGKSLYLTKRYAEALIPLEEGLARFPDYDGLHQWLAPTYAQLGKQVEARKHAEIYMALKPGVTLSGLAKKLPYKNQADLDHLFDGMRKAGVLE
ncbi:tetratricopeptide repeat protein [Sulfitobacter mediterraneus]|uniref:tetratricopeptide repeat protein n=2 Tax=Sulfitobacter mediterraneus TaxID=83219 RepID=UPI001931F895|nr:tetratricopeptide repeat protein [Sulfitobacter mediterraneus]MBM1634977.1 tetratricopeptide repeat protein [Sulfitobacter mediterraneus]MBM1646782.1 tetratricopeptide repeat protein [Sulfitobacter mediterraneus]MBM1650890.1 tetratricopeptide repeat protein [Sulfitobacter mediterraneus]MBM1658989.1 tetratricopeptide repeat protein [Sulfitobacter mediterraneus]MBM1663028.1 tetratricopeptide repeat protein [Sulfitobacter mediterraneus]